MLRSKRSRGYLLLDISVSAAIFSMFSIAITFIFYSYLSLKEINREREEVFYAVIKEISENVSFYNFEEYNLKTYYLNINNLEELKEKDILYFFHDYKVIGNEYFLLEIRNRHKDYVEYSLKSIVDEKEVENLEFIKFNRSGI